MREVRKYANQMLQSMQNELIIILHKCTEQETYLYFFLHCVEHFRIKFAQCESENIGPLFVMGSQTDLKWCISSQ